MKAETGTCSSCGTEIPSGASWGVCPRCLYRLGFDQGAESGLQAEPAAPDAPSELEPSSALGDIRHFGDYELLEEIGHGGMGVLYKARQKSLDRIVALKLLLFGPHAPPESVKRFRAEAVAAAALQHPNIVAIHEVGFCEGQHFIAMDYVAGHPLSELIRGNPLPARRAAGYLKTIAEAMHCAHEHGILHRDLKPGNVLIDANDQPRVTDFGLARRLVCFLPMSGGRAVVFLPDGGGLLACGRSGVQRWRILTQPPEGEFRFGPAEHLGEVVAPALLSPDGRSLLAAEANLERVVLLHPARLSEPVRCATHTGMASLAASPDGKWLATGTWKGTGVRVFALPSGELRQELSVKGSAGCAFSPDGQWLATGSAAEYCLWRVGSWQQPVWTVAREGAGDTIGSLVFSPDGRMLALLYGRSTRIKLVAAADGRELATLETGRALCFSPDGSRLATIADDGHSVLLWDLQLTRRQLAAMKLDWDLPPSP